MNTHPNAMPPSVVPHRSFSPVWLRIAAGLLLVIVAALFFFLASARLRHRFHEEAPPAGSVPDQTAPVIPH